MVEVQTRVYEILDPLCNDGKVPTEPPFPKREDSEKSRPPASNCLHEDFE